MYGHCLRPDLITQTEKWHFWDYEGEVITALVLDNTPQKTLLILLDLVFASGDI